MKIYSLEKGLLKSEIAGQYFSDILSSPLGTFFLNRRGAGWGDRIKKLGIGSENNLSSNTKTELLGYNYYFLH